MIPKNFELEWDSMYSQEYSSEDCWLVKYQYGEPVPQEFRMSCTEELNFARDY